MRPRVRVEEEVGRGEAVGAVWALTGGIHDTTALCVRDSELVRMSKVSLTYCPPAPLLAFVPEVVSHTICRSHPLRML